MLWPFIPRDSLIEALDFRSDVLRARSAEQRIRLANGPRRNLAHDYILTPQQHELALSLLFAAAPGPYDVPDWMEWQRGSIAQGADTITVDTTAARYAVGGRAVLWQDWQTAEVLTIDSLTDTSLTFTTPASRTYTQAVIAPVSTAYAPQGLELSRRAETAFAARMEWDSDDVLDLADDTTLPDTYQGDPLVLAARVGANSFSDRLLREVEIVDNGIAARAYDSTLSTARRTMGVAWITQGAAELWLLRRQLHTLRGRVRAFWAPAWNNGLRLAANASGGAGTISVQYAGLSLAPAAGDLFIKRRDGSTLALRYTAAVQAGANETLTLSGTLPSALNVADIVHFGRLLRVRLDADRVELAHSAPRFCRVIAPVIEVPA